MWLRMVAALLAQRRALDMQARLIERQHAALNLAVASVREQREYIRQLELERRRLIAGLQAANAGALAAMRPEARA